MKDEKALQFNPFFAAAEDYAEVLRRGLEQSRREKGDDHEETLANLAALAVHLEEIANTADVSSVLSAVVLTKAEARRAKEEAAEFQREHARFTAQIAARKQAEHSREP